MCSTVQGIKTERSLTATSMSHFCAAGSELCRGQQAPIFPPSVPLPQFSDGEMSSFRLDINPRSWLTGVTNDPVALVAKSNHLLMSLAHSLISLSTSSCCVLSTLMHNGCRTSARWKIHTGGGQWDPPLTVERFDCLEKHHLNPINYYCYSIRNV